MIERKTGTPPTDDRDWSALTLGERIRQIEVEGYLLIPNLLSAKQIAKIKAQVSTLETKGQDYSEHQRTAGDVMFLGGEIAELAAHPTTISFLRAMLGKDIVCVKGDYSNSQPGHPGLAIHTDADLDEPPVMIRVLYYLDELTPKRSPFGVIPYSHLSLHAEGSPYKRYLHHPDQLMVLAKAGSAILINHRVFHSNFPNSSNEDREMVAYAYRPGWCGPGEERPPWDQNKLEALPPEVGNLFTNPNIHYDDHFRGNWPSDMATSAPGISPDRWS